MLTTAVTLPIFIMLLIGMWYLFLILSTKLSLNEGVRDAAHYISENARYWAIDPSGQSNVGGDLLPSDYYEIQARRMIESRLRDVIFYPSQMITDSLTVKVQEPILAWHPDSTDQPIAEGWTDDLCYWRANAEKEYRHWKNIRFRVWAQFKVPLWTVTIPWMDSFDVTLTDRAIGYVQCPRWRGKREADNFDKSKYLGSEGPYRVFRALSTAAPIPTVTEMPTPTRKPTSTPGPPTATRPAPGP